LTDLIWTGNPRMSSRCGTSTHLHLGSCIGFILARHEAEQASIRRADIHLLSNLVGVQQPTANTWLTTSAILKVDRSRSSPGHIPAGEMAYYYCVIICFNFVVAAELGSFHL